MPTFESLQGRNQALIRKFLNASVFVGPTGGTAITAITTTAGALLPLPANHTDVGLLTEDDGITWTKDTDSNDTRSYGFSDPTRRDITTDVTGIQFTAQESKRAVMELYMGLDLSATKSAATGEVVIDKPSRPGQRYFSVLALAKDGDGVNSIYTGRWLPRCSVTDVAEQTWQVGAATEYGITMTAYVDPTVGTACREFWGGPGMLGGLAVAMGFPAT